MDFRILHAGNLAIVRAVGQPMIALINALIVLIIIILKG